MVSKRKGMNHPMRSLTLSQLYQNPLKVHLGFASFVVWIIVENNLLVATQDLELMRWNPEPAATVNQERFVYRNNFIDVKVRQVDGRICGNVEGEKCRRRSGPDDGKQTVLVLSSDDLIGFEDLKWFKAIQRYQLKSLAKITAHQLRNFFHRLTRRTTSPSRNFCSTVLRIEFFIGSFMIAPVNHTLNAIKLFFLLFSHENIFLKPSSGVWILTSGVACWLHEFEIYSVRISNRHVFAVTIYRDINILFFIYLKSKFQWHHE